MKKLAILMVCSIFSALVGINLKATAIETTANTQNPKLVTFIYINGSNNMSFQNRDKFKEAFFRDVKKMHPIMIKGFEEDELAQKLFLKNGEYKINPDPITFYWGHRSLTEIEKIDSNLDAAKKYTPKVAHYARSLFAHCLHDAVWVQKFSNMTVIIDDLHEIVKAETDKGNKVVLLGYSAGSFVTYQYFLHKFPSMLPEKVLPADIDLQITSNNQVNKTCLDALLETKIVKLDNTGRIYANPNTEIIKENYPNLNKKTQDVCFLNNEVRGIINFASPLSLFYSNATDSTTSLNLLTRLMFKNIIENDIFFLIVNYRNDPFGFPNQNNHTVSNMKDADVFASMSPNNGFFYNKSDLYLPRTFVTAHLAYWYTPKRFVKGVIKAYNAGYKNFYELHD